MKDSTSIKDNVSCKEMQGAYREGKSFMPGRPAKISLPTLDGYYFVSPEDIVRCAASGSYTVFHFKDKTKITVSLRLKICEAKLPCCRFFRIHHSHIVNLDFIARYVRAKSGYIVLSDGTQVEVAASRKEAFLEWIQQL